MASKKTLAVLGQEGVGKRTIVGTLIYKFGLDLRQLQEMERGADRKIESIVPFYEEHGLPKAFYVQSSEMVVEDTPTPNVAFWVVDASSPDGGESSKAELESLISTGSLRPTEKLIVVLNKMVSVVPLAALRGHDILAPPSGVSWTKGPLMQALA